jgi:hypothetical protein
MKFFYTLTAAVFCILLEVPTSAQTFSSSNTGSFSTGSNWSGGTAPPLSGQTYGSVTVNHTMNITGNYTVGSFILNVQAGNTLTINGNLTQSNSGGTINVSGTLIITGTLSVLSSASSFNILPGGSVIVTGNTSISNNNSIVVGTNAAPPPYANLVLQSNVSFASGGAGMTINRNGRVAVYGNLTGSGGGSVLQINNGGQMYVNGNINLSGNGAQINNSNSTSPYGLYVNGTTTNSGGGASTTLNKADKTTMQATNPDFSNWIASLPNSPLPVTLIEFKISTISENEISLAWSTASELNFDYFIVEKSIDGKIFNPIARIKGHGTSSVQHDYEFTDSKPFVGKNYYHLTSVDFDGYTERFKVIGATFESGKKISVYPNPLVGDKLHIELNFEEGNTTRINLTDSYGILVLSVTSADAQTMIPLSLAPGVYIVTVTHGSVKQVSRLLVR